MLVTKHGIVKLCDFGFARILSTPGVTCTDYVATRWYRAPELLVGDAKYGKEVDIWAIGCLFAEMKTGEPLFPGESDIDQLFRILCHIGELGDLAPRHKEIISNNPMFKGLKTQSKNTEQLQVKFANWDKYSLKFLQDCLKLDPDERIQTCHLLEHRYFTWDGFREKFHMEFRRKLQEEFSKCHWMLQQQTGNRVEKDTRKETVKDQLPEENKFSFAYHGLPPTTSKARVPVNLTKTPGKVTQFMPFIPRIVTNETTQNQDYEPSEIKTTPLAIIPPITHPRIMHQQHGHGGTMTPHPFQALAANSGDDLEPICNLGSARTTSMEKLALSPTPSIFPPSRSPRYHGSLATEMIAVKKMARTDMNFPRVQDLEHADRSFQIGSPSSKALGLSVNPNNGNTAQKLFSLQGSFPKFLPQGPSSPKQKETGSPTASNFPGQNREYLQPNISFPRWPNS